MSRIGRAPIPVPTGVKVDIDDHHVVVTGPKGQLERDLHPEMILEQSEAQILVKRPSESKWHKSLHGLTRSLLANMVTGVTTGFTRNLEINGVGYRAQKYGNRLVLFVGYSHPVEINPPEGVSFTVEGVNKVAVSGINREVVGETAARIRRVRKPEPYKGKGIKYAEEVIRRKAGKAGKVGGKKK